MALTFREVLQEAAQFQKCLFELRLKRSVPLRQGRFHLFCEPQNSIAVILSQHVQHKRRLATDHLIVQLSRNRIRYVRAATKHPTHRKLRYMEIQLHEIIPFLQIRRNGYKRRRKLFGRHLHRPIELALQCNISRIQPYRIEVITSLRDSEVRTSELDPAY
jgi:hypothetical protein